MSLNISTEAPTKVRASVQLRVDNVLDMVKAQLAEQGDEIGLPEGATLFLVTETMDDKGDKSVKRQAVNPNNGNGTSMFLEIPFWQSGDTRTAIGGRARKNTTSEPEPTSDN